MITNTSKIHPSIILSEMMINGSDKFIADMEAGGQRELCDQGIYCQLPRRVTSPEDRYAELGIEVLGVCENDPIFQNCKLPAGWRIVRADNCTNYWSDIKDSNGQIVASIFYKAAHYDRRASITFASKDRI